MRSRNKSFIMNSTHNERYYVQQQLASSSRPHLVLQYTIGTPSSTLARGLVPPLLTFSDTLAVPVARPLAAVALAGPVDPKRVALVTLEVGAALRLSLAFVALNDALHTEASLLNTIPCIDRSNFFS